MSSSPIPAESLRNPIVILEEKLKDLTAEEKKATAVALERLLQNQEYRKEAPKKLVETLDLIQSALEKPENYAETQREQLAFSIALSKAIQEKIKTLNSFINCILC